MTVLLVGVAALGVLAVLAVGGWRLWVLDRDLTLLDKDFIRLQDELHAAQQQQARATDRRLRDAETVAANLKLHVEWMGPWVRYWAASQKGRR